MQYSVKLVYQLCDHNRHKKVHHLCKFGKFIARSPRTFHYFILYIIRRECLNPAVF
jgi:hypothetical protein